MSTIYARDSWSRILIQQIRFPLRYFSYSCLRIIWRLKFAGLFMLSGANATLNTPNRRLGIRDFWQFLTYAAGWSEYGSTFETHA